MIEIEAAAKPANKVGRRPAGRKRQGRYMRWYLAYLMGQDTMRQIGLAEQPPVSEATVSRGIARAKQVVASRGAAASVLALFGLDLESLAPSA